MDIPPYLLNWFKQKDWTMYPYQRSMFKHFYEQDSTLLIVPTGGGKTLASFLPSLVDLQTYPRKGLHTLYISPLKALTNDVQRNLLDPIQEMDLRVEVAVRTGDTSTYKRQRQRNNPPHILLTTPESLLLLLSYSSAKEFFKPLKAIIIDEVHSLANTKRGDLLSLALAQLHLFASKTIRIGLSATVAKPTLLAEWLAQGKNKVQVVEVETKQKPKIQILNKSFIPYSGFMGTYAVTDIYQLISQHTLSLIFVNTRAQAELIFQQLWLINDNNYPIALYHGSLDKQLRLKTEYLMVSGNLKAIVSTSALELGIDWGNVDLVIQLGAPHGISRLLQRIGRSNHQINKPSKAQLVPTHCFDALECQAAIDSINKNHLDGENFRDGSLDVVVQFIINCACSQPISATQLYQTICSAFPYRNLSKKIFGKLFQFAINGGYTLQHYDQYHRLQLVNKTFYQATNPKVIRRHRQNIGTIIESARLRIKVLNKRKSKIVGEIEEAFIQQLSPGEHFLFGGEILEFIRIRDLFVEAKKTKQEKPKIPSYLGGSLPLSTSLADEVHQLLNDAARWTELPKNVQEWLMLQKKFSDLPTKNLLLVEQFEYRKTNYLVCYPFAGKRANYTLGMLITRHLERLHLKPISFKATDYGLAVNTMRKLDESIIKELFTIQVAEEEIEHWLKESPLLKRCFREVAIISGLTERQSAGKRKTMKQVTFSTDLIYDVLTRYEPEHILLAVTYEDVIKTFLDIDRILEVLKGLNRCITLNGLIKPSPFSIPILTTLGAEKIRGEAIEETLFFAEAEIEAKYLINEVKKIV